MDGYECGGFLFYSNFDSANLGRVECVPESESVPTVSVTGKIELPDVEFNIWTKPDCAGTEFENGNRTWFYFGMKGLKPSLLVKFNIIDLNKQSKMYSQGMAPVYKIVPGKAHWDRVRDKPTYSMTDNVFKLSFKFRTSDNLNSILHLAFTYPYSYLDLQNHLANLDLKFVLQKAFQSHDDIYYHREKLCNSLEGRNVDLLTITSHHGISNEREVRLKHLFPDDNVPRPFRFFGKKIIFISARVHPGETPSTFVFNGFLNLLLSPDDPTAIILRRLYVFKLIPFLNPDGVSNGFYRTDTMGVNLNRVYLNPALIQHPSIYAARALIRFYHYGHEKDECIQEIQHSDSKLPNIISHMTLEENCPPVESHRNVTHPQKSCKCLDSANANKCDATDVNNENSGLFLYIDMHGHASKKGIFMYGNYFDNVESTVECMLLPKIMSLNNHNFHFTACNFTERNMYTRDKRDGMSKEGSGRVAVYKLTGLVRSYTLECNYNTGRLVNILPPATKEGAAYKGVAHMTTPLLPPKYNPQIFEEVGRSLGVSILDLTSGNPHSRITYSEYRSLSGLRDWLRLHCAGPTPPKGPGNAHKVVGGALHHMAHHHHHHQGCSNIHRNSASVFRSRCLSGSKYSKKKMSSSAGPIIVTKTEKAGANLAQSGISQPSCSKVVNNPTSRLVRSRSKQKLLKKEQGGREESKPLVERQKPNVSSAVNHVSRNISNVGGGKTSFLYQKKRTPLFRDSISKQSSPNRLESASTDQSSGFRLKEICFMKGAEPSGGVRKKMIAKYVQRASSATKGGSQGAADGDRTPTEESLIVTWAPGDDKAQVYSHKGTPHSSMGGYRTPPPLSEGGSTSTPLKQGAFRVHNFSRTTSATCGRMSRSNRTNVRRNLFKRLSNTSEAPSKLEKLKKRKKLKK